MPEISILTDATFKTEVIESSLPVLVDFTAEWCGPCRQLAPIVDQIAGEYAARLRVGRLDVDENIKTAMGFGVMSLPTLILFKDGQPVERMMGFQPRPKILEKLKKYLE